MSMHVALDLVDADEVRESVQAHGDRYLKRVFTEREARQCAGNPGRLAGRFAAKEATMKLLRTGDEPLPWRSIGVHARPGGELAIELSGAAAVLAARRGLGELSVSVTHRRSLVASLVLGEVGSAR
jgi:holo-[acyl-carrier protein] synthase